MIVCGGIYVERCTEPDWQQLFGSGGRAAGVLASASENVILASYAADALRPAIESLSATYAFNTKLQPARETVSFNYVHGLSVPVITPSANAIHIEAPLIVTDDIVLRFGMMEGDAQVTARLAVYDPQSPYTPQMFSANGSSADRLVLVLNGAEARALSGINNLEGAAQEIRRHEQAEAVVVKLGARGALVATASGSERVPAYRSARVWPVGSGDVFAASFTYYWTVRGCDVVHAADLASRATSMYCENRSLPTLNEDYLRTRTPVDPSSGRVYLAGPFFNLPQHWMINEARAALLSQGLQVFSPLHDVGRGPAAVVAPADLDGLRISDRVLALIDDEDVGTVFEIGYARALDLPVIVFSQRLPSEMLKMIEGTGCKVVNDFVTSVYETAWL